MEYPYLFAQTPVSSNKLRAKYTILLFRVVMIVVLLSIVLNVSILRAINEDYTLPPIAILVAGISQLVFFVPYILLAVFFLLWMNRAYQNLHQAEVKGLSYSKGWAIGVWFIPIANFFLPDTIMKEIWDKTQDTFRDEQPYEKKKNALVSSWWFAYIIAGIFKAISYYLFIHQAIEAGYAIAIIGNVISLFALVYGVRMVKNISVFEKEMMDRAATIYQAHVTASVKNYLETINPSPGNTLYGPVEIASPFPVKETFSPQVEYAMVGDHTDNSERSKFLLLGLKVLIFITFLFGSICVYIATETKSGDQYEIFQAASRWLDKIIWSGSLVFGITFIILLLWMKRAYSNLHNLDVKGLSFGANAAVYSWFIPGANLFLPYVILQDINRHLQQVINREKFPAGKHPANHTIIIIFWLLLLLSGVFLYKCLTGMSQQFSFSFYMLPNVSYYAWFGIYAAITGGAAFYFGIMIVNAVSSLEAQLFSRLEVEVENMEEVMSDKEEVISDKEEVIGDKEEKISDKEIRE
jgi:hypothetical protein